MMALRYTECKCVDCWIAHAETEAIQQGISRELYNSSIGVFIRPTEKENIESLDKELEQYFQVNKPCKVYNINIYPEGSLGYIADPECHTKTIARAYLAKIFNTSNNKLI